MRKTKVVLFSMMTFIILSMSLASAGCTVDLDKDVYDAGETITATMSCEGDGILQYELTWTNSSGATIEQDNGTYITKDTNFTEIYNLPSDYFGIINAILTKNESYRNESSAIVNKLIIPSSAEVCDNGIDDDLDGNIDGKDSDCRNGDGACVTNWIWNGNDWVKEDWVHPKIKEIIAEFGMDSPEYAKWKDNWNTIPGEICVAVDENGKMMAKPTTEPTSIIEDKQETEVKEEIVIETVEVEPIKEEKKGFFNWLKGLFTRD